MSAQAFVAHNLYDYDILTKGKDRMNRAVTAVHRTHAICMGHRVCGHESKCAHLHGHNYRFHFTCEADELDSVGRVVDFSVIKDTLCAWLENEWDHKFLFWEHDETARALSTAVALAGFDSLLGRQAEDMWDDSIVWVNFNPTAENIAAHMVEVVGPRLLSGMGVRLVSVTVDETDKCSASYTLTGGYNE